MIIAALLGALTFGACIDNNESASVENVRNAKAEQLKSLAALNNAQAQAALIAANAEASLKASQAAINQAEAAIKAAEARLQEALAEAQEIKNEQALAELEVKIAQYEAEIVKWQMLKAQYVSQMETDAIKAEQQLLAAQLELIKQEREFNSKLDEFANEDAQILRELYRDYSAEVRSLNKAVAGVVKTENFIAKVKADLVDAEECAADYIAEREAEIANLEARVAVTQEFVALIKEAHADEILSDEEIQELYDETFAEYIKLLEAYEVAEAAATEAWEVVSDAQEALDAVADTTDDESAKSVLEAAKTAYLSAVNAFVTAGAMKLNDDESDATGNTGVSSWGYYSNNALTGVNSVYNEIIANTEAPAYNSDDEDDVLDGTFEYSLYTINEKNLEAYVALLKGKEYTAEEKAALEKAVKDAKAAYDKAVAAVPAAEKAAADAKAAYEKAEADKVAADDAYAAWDKAYKAVATTISKKQTELYAAWEKAKAAYDAAVKAYEAAQKANLANPTTANALAESEAKTEMLKAENAMKLASAEHDAYLANQELNKQQAYLALGDGSKEKKAAEAAAEAATMAEAAYILAVKALGEAPKYKANGDWDGDAKYFDGTVSYDAKKGTSKLGSADADIDSYEDYIANQTYEYLNDKKETKEALSAHASVIATQKAVAAAEDALATAEAGNAEFVENVDALIAAIEETAAEYEAAAKAYNEAWAAASAVYAEAYEAWEVADEAADEAEDALDAIDDVFDSIGDFSHGECAELLEDLTSLIESLEDDIEELQGEIEDMQEAIAEGKLSTEKLVAALEKQLADQQLLVEIETIYVETAKAALDAALEALTESEE